MKIIPVSPVDPVGEMVVETAVGYPLFKGMSWAGNQLLKDYARDFAFTRLGNRVRNKILSSALNKNVKAWNGAGRFSYEGLILPDKRITTTNNSTSLIKPTLDNATYLTNQSIDALQDVAINTKDKEYLSNLIKHNFQQKSNGNGIFSVYHATDRGPFNQFKPTKGHMGGMVEPFYHFGGKSTKEFFERMPEYKIKKFDINGKNLITVDDFTHERPMDFITELYRKGYISRDRLTSYRDLLYSREYLDDPHSFVQRVLNDLNSNGIRYVNQIEGKGTESIGIPDAKNIKLSNLFTYDDNGNLIPLSKRADFTKDDVRFNFGKDIHIKKGKQR